jgi:hypothetical protein
MDLSAFITIFLEFITMLIIFFTVGFIVVYGVTSILFFISEQTSLIKIYHVIKTPKEGCEEFIVKLVKISSCNFNLSIPLILTFIFIIKNTVGNNFKTDTAFLISLILTIGTLYSFRSLSNPTNRIFKPKSIELFLDPDRKIEEIKMYQERMASFFFSFISATILFILVAFLYTLFIPSADKSMIINLASIVMPMSSMTFSFTDFGILFICYTVSLTVFTTWGEYRLRANKPLLQMQ